jgi:hypothetical protein
MGNLMYTGIGSRRTPPEFLAQMRQWAQYLLGRGWWLRSGGAKGADTAFADGADNHKIIYTTNSFEGASQDQRAYALRLAAHHHPAWGACPLQAQKLHARNGYQILGLNLKSPTHLVVCWTPDGAERGHQTSRRTGGTGQAIRIASAHNIPVVNMQRDGWYDRLLQTSTRIEQNNA